MKSFLVIGAGKFGNHLCHNLNKYDVEVMIIDTDEEKVDALLPYVTNAKIGDCTNPEVTKSLGVSNFDAVFVCIGEDFQNSLEITSMVKEFGATYVISLASRDIHAKFLLRNGADDVIYPDRDIAERMARKYSNDSIFEYFAIDSDFGIYEVEPFKECVGKTLKEVDFRKKYNANIIGYKKDGKTQMLIDPEYVFKEDEHLIIVGNTETVDKLFS